ncbi:hypothetical protein ATCC90586_009772 [Pythium insidiosum]|nr:hypothetical protein ATCC90586_009772 [Pythium insidiosum]
MTMADGRQRQSSTSLLTSDAAPQTPDEPDAVDIDAILHEIRIAKEKELRLRAEKERVRKELEQMRSPDWWARESAAQQRLQATRKQREALEQREAEELRRVQEMECSIAAKHRNVVLRPEDFDDIQYRVEMVKVGETSRSAILTTVHDRMELLESAFVFVVGLVVLGGVVALGVVSAHDISPEWRTLAWSLSPMLLLPLAWIAVMHAWERHLENDPAMAVITFTPLYGVRSPERCGAYLLEIDEVCILLDCGWTDEYDEALLQPLARVASRIDLVLISHPDLAHMGALPYAIGKLGLNAPVYGTLPVHRMGQIALYEALLAKTRRDGTFELFTLDDVDAVFERFKQLKYSEKLTLTSSGEGIVITPHVAGHLIGGSIWRIVKETDDIIYAVDYNHRSEHVLQKTILDSFTRPTLLITDSMNIHTEQPKLKDRDSKVGIMVEILKTVRAGGSVLIPTDSSGRVLELMRVLDQYWIQNKLRDPIVLLHDMAYYTPKAAQAMLEWCNERIAKNFDVGRQNPFQFSHIHLIHTMEELDSLPSPKVVLATSYTLEDGFAKELFVRWASDSRNSIIFTQTLPPSCLASRVLHAVMDDAGDRTVSFKINRKVLLEGAELALYEAKERRRQRVEAENKAKEMEAAAMEDMMMNIGDYESESDEETPEDTVVKDEPKVEWDEYGEIITPEDFKDATLSGSRHSRRQASSNNEKGDQDVDMDDDEDDEEAEAVVDNRPTKTVTDEMVLKINARVAQVDFSGLADGRAIRNCLSNVKPRKLILVHGTEETTMELKRFVEATINTCEAVFTPNAMECIDIESDTNVFKLVVKESLYTSASFRKVGTHEVAYISGQYELPENRALLPVLQRPADASALDRHDPMLLSDGKIKLDVMKQVLAKAGFNAKFRGGMLVCNDGVVLRRAMNNEIIVEGALSSSYYKIRKLLYEQFTLI